MWYLQMTIKVTDVRFKNHPTHTYQIFQSTKAVSHRTRLRVTRNTSISSNGLPVQRIKEAEWILESEQIMNAQHPAFCVPDLYPIGCHLFEMCRFIQHKYDQHDLKTAGY